MTYRAWNTKEVDRAALKELTAMLGQTGASRANSFIYEHSLGTSFTAEQSADTGEQQGEDSKQKQRKHFRVHDRMGVAKHAEEKPQHQRGTVKHQFADDVLELFESRFSDCDSEEQREKQR